MKLTLFNGSPRGISSNSRFLLDCFAEGFNLKRADSDSIMIENLSKLQNLDHLKEQFYSSDSIIFSFPLYVDSMPGKVKQFIEELTLEQDSVKKDKKIGFIIHSGFPERSHCDALERYLKKLSHRLNCVYLGTVIKGGTEIMRIPPIQKNPFYRFICFVGSLFNLGKVGALLSKERIRKRFSSLGMSFAQHNQFDQDITKRFHSQRRLSSFGFFLYKTIGTKLYWNLQLKSNNALKKHGLKPYQ